MSQTLKQLRGQLGVYRGVADPLSGETAAVVLADLERRFSASVTAKECRDLEREAVRLSRALRRAVAEWQAERTC